MNAATSAIDCKTTDDREGIHAASHESANAALAQRLSLTGAKFADDVAVGRTPVAVLHDSDCAVHNGPAEPEGPCNCGAEGKAGTGVHGDATDIPKQWTFKSDSVANNFDKHVREQLPWYDMATQLVTHFGRHYLPKKGRMYDVGSSTGNITKALKDEILSREVEAISLDNSPQMVSLWDGVGTNHLADVEDFEFESYDFCVCFLVLMFLSPAQQKAVFQKMYSKLRPGGAMIVFEKVEAQDGYLGTVFHRLTMQGKVTTGVSPEEIIKKELSLSGMQRPLNPDFMKFNAANCEVAFRYGEFVGWVVIR